MVSLWNCLFHSCRKLHNCLIWRGTKMGNKLVIFFWRDSWGKIFTERGEASGDSSAAATAAAEGRPCGTRCCVQEEWGCKEEWERQWERQRFGSDLRGRKQAGQEEGGPRRRWRWWKRLRVRKKCHEGWTTKNIGSMLEMCFLEPKHSYEFKKFSDKYRNLEDKWWRPQILSCASSKITTVRPAYMVHGLWSFRLHAVYIFLVASAVLG